MRLARAVAMVALLIAVTGVGALPGCNAPARTPRPDVTGGRRIEMFVSSKERRFERYRVGTDGVVHWAGGADALSAKFTWSGPLTADEVERLFDAIEREGWFEHDPPSTREPPDTTYDVQIRGPAGRESFTATGDAPGLVEVRRILEQASLRRLDGYLDALPQPR